MKLRHLGDVLLASPVFTVLKRAFPRADIDAYVYREAAPVLEGHPAISRIAAYRRLRGIGRLAEELRLLSLIRKGGYNLVLNLTEGDRGAFAARVSGASIRVGVDERRVYTHRVKRGPSLRHTVERDLDALRRIGIFPAEEEKRLVFSIPEAAHLSAARLVPWETFTLLHPASRWRFKCWPAGKMRALAERLIERGEKVVLTAGSDPAERAMAEEIAQGLPVCNLAGKTSLKELGALIERSSRMVTIDSVALHLASALGARAVVLFGPTSEITWGPWMNDRIRVIAKPLSCRPCYLDGCGGSKRSECLHAISVDDVWSQLEFVPEVGSSRLRIVDEVGDRSR